MFLAATVLIAGGSATLVSNSGTDSNGDSAQNAVSQPEYVNLGKIDLTADLKAQGFDYWGEARDFLYRWQADGESTPPCKSKSCAPFFVQSSPECKSVTFTYNEVDVNENVLGTRRDGANTQAGSGSKNPPGWATLQSNLAKTDSFRILEIKCSADWWNWHNRDDGSAARKSGQSLTSTIQLPDAVGATEKDLKTWMASAGAHFTLKVTSKSGAPETSACRIDGSREILTQNPGYGSVVENSAATVLRVEVGC